MRRVVVGVDFSDGSMVALRWAARVARVNAVPLQLVSSWEHAWWAFMPAPFALAPVPAAEDLSAVLGQQLNDLITTEGLADVATVPSLVMEGGAANALVELVDADDLLVVGSRGHGAARDTLLGSVATRVTSLAPCIVAVVPNEAAANRSSGPVIIGVDGSDNSIAAVRWAGENADPDAEIVVISVWGVPMILGQEGVGTDLSQVLESDKERAEIAAQAAADVLTELGRTFRLDVEQGEARRLLTERAHDASMLVLGHRGRSGIAHALLGSVTTSLVHHPECVVVVVPGH